MTQGESLDALILRIRRLERRLGAVSDGAVSPYIRLDDLERRIRDLAKDIDPKQFHEKCRFGFNYNFPRLTHF
jgi:hypothetical protein